jgi:tRNA modification GTPase
MRGIVRMSGHGSFDVLNALASCAIARQRGCASLRLKIGGHDLPVLAMLMPGPQSYTGEDSTEVQAPGNPVLLERVVEALLAAAARLEFPARRAEPGEFTARAFLNGRLTLTEAEGVAATIAARSDAELHAAGLLRRGVLGRLAIDLADQLGSALALVEAGIDFTDQEDVTAIAPADLHRRLVDLHARLEAKLNRSVGMEQLEAIPWVVLTGPPNAGKSTLFNALLGRKRAVVSSVAGTTRDVLAEPLRIATDHGPAEVMLVDLAGLDAADELMNRMMQEQARQAIERAELVIECSASDVPYEPSDAVANRSTLRITTKCDLSECASSVLAVSAHSGAGLEELRKAIAARLSDRAVSLAADALALTPRHEAAMRSACEHLAEAIALAEPYLSDRALRDAELIAASMRAALDDLAALAGAISPDDVLGRIFATFCVGK